MIDNHSVAVDLLIRGDVMDAGCRGFAFSKWFKDRGHFVVSVDPSPDLDLDQPDTDYFYRQALVGVGQPDFAELNVHGDPGAWHLQPKTVISLPTVPCVSILDWGQRNWDVVKLNIEGSEYDVLDTWPGPIARQIVVSFHEHTNRARGRQECDRLIEKMSQWYAVFNRVWERRYCCSENYWDVLFVRKDLA